VTVSPASSTGVLVLPHFTRKKSYVYGAINRERGSSSLPKVKEAIILFIYFSILTFIIILLSFYFYFYFNFISFYIFSYFFLCQPPSHSLLLPADRQPLRSRVGFYLLVAGLINPTALLMRAKFFNLPVPIGQDYLNSPALHDGSFNNN